jgi:RNA recognition motif-containing protein
VHIRGTTRTLYVGGFPAATTPAMLRDLFAPHGEIEDVRLVDRGEASFAYVTFVCERDAFVARHELDGTRFAGRLLRVEIAQ